MAKLSTAKEVVREKKQQKAMSNVLASTGLSQLTPIQPVTVKTSAKGKGSKKTPK